MNSPVTNYERDSLRLEHILNAVEKILRYASEGKRDDKTEDAIERNIGIIGEACRVYQMN